MQARFTTIIAGCALFATGCLYSPVNDTTVPTRDDGIHFEGTLGQPGPPQSGDVRIEAARAPGADFDEIFAFEADGQGAFDETEPVPIDRWTPLCQAGSGWETFVRARVNDSSATLATYEAASVSGFDGRTCVEEAIAAGDWWAAGACASPDAPIVRLVASEGAGDFDQTVVVGDVVIDDPADADALACVHTIEGSLTIDDGVVEDVTFPSLESVTGSLTIVYEREPMPLIAARHEVVDLRALTNVGGDVTLLFPQPAGAMFNNQNVIVRDGMPELATVGGDVTFLADVFNLSGRALNGVSLVPGDVTFGGDIGGDVNATQLLGNVVSIGGDLMVDHGPSTQSDFFRHLETVGGNATLMQGVWVSNDGSGRMYRDLISVGGTLTVSGAFLSAPGGDDLARALDALTSAGAFDWDGGGGFGGIGSNAVSVGALRLHDDDSVNDADAIFAKYTIDPTGSIEVTDNANLPECDVLDWIAALPGHVGPTTVGGNLACGRGRVLELVPPTPIRFDLSTDVTRASRRP